MSAKFSIEKNYFKSLDRGCEPHNIIFLTLYKNINGSFSFFMGPGFFSYKFRICSYNRFYVPVFFFIFFLFLFHFFFCTMKTTK